MNSQQKIRLFYINGSFTRLYINVIEMLRNMWRNERGNVYGVPYYVQYWVDTLSFWWEYVPQNVYIIPGLTIVIRDTGFSDLICSDNWKNTVNRLLEPLGI